jgi:L-2-hydroxyglutarate oxidase LhgO
VVGAGVVGLAIARALALRGLEVLVIEKEPGIGYGTSSRNSEVIHAGLYYKPGSLKARLCVDGRRALYRYCNERHLPHKRCGKLVVAVAGSEEAFLDELAQRAEVNGVEEFELINQARLNALEPSVQAVSALMSPCTGIIDSHSLMLSYQADIEDAGGTIVFRTPVLEAAIDGHAVKLRTGGLQPAELETALVINATGLDAWEFSSRVTGLDTTTIPPRYLAKGSYFGLKGKTPFRHLIYPVPEPGGLGIHLTLDLAGQARFGPDVEWVDNIDYDVDLQRGRLFYEAIRRYWPGLHADALMPAYSGIRPKTTAAGQESGDFVIQGPKETGHRGYIALYGIESPGLTASLAIGDLVAELI